MTTPCLVGSCVVLHPSFMCAVATVVIGLYSSTKMCVCVCVCVCVLRKEQEEIRGGCGGDGVVIGCEAAEYIWKKLCLYHVYGIYDLLYGSMLLEVLNIQLCWLFFFNMPP